jgi:hypothetical protein
VVDHSLWSAPFRAELIIPRIVDKGSTCPYLRVSSGTARLLLLTVGAPSLDFLREVGEVCAAGPILERLVEVAGRHRVTPAFELPGD